VVNTTEKRKGGGIVLISLGKRLDQHSNSKRSGRKKRWSEEIFEVHEKQETAAWGKTDEDPLFYCGRRWRAAIWKQMRKRSKIG